MNSSRPGRTPINNRRLIASVGLLAICALNACGGSDGEQGSGAIRSGLEQIPLVAYESAYDVADSVDVTIGDITAAAAFNGLAEPESGRDETEISQWLADLSFGDPDAAIEMSLPLPRGLDVFLAPPDLVNDELGIDLGAITSYAALEAPLGAFAFLSGDVELDTSLDNLGDGVVGYGSGDDLEANVDEASPLSRIGRPLRFAQRADGIAVSYTTASIEAFIADDETLADDGRFVAVADALDAAGAVGAYIVERDFSAEVLGGVPTEQFPDEPAASIGEFGIVGIGIVDNAGKAANVVVYHFDDDDAEDSVDVLQDLWTDARLFSVGAPISDFFDVVSVAAAAAGSTVTVTLELVGDRSTTVLVDMLAQREVMFVHE